jgi:hypothetical protein
LAAMAVGADDFDRRMDIEAHMDRLEIRENP